MISRRPLLTTAATLAFATLAFGQGVVTAPTTADGQAAPPGTPPGPRLTSPPSGALPKTGTVTAAPSDTPLMPDQTPSLVKPEGGTGDADKKKEKTSKTEVFEQDLQERIRFREVKTRALADPAVIAQWDKSNAARTDAVKRIALKEYYRLLFARMTKIDSSLKKLIDAKALDADHRVTQSRIAPTEVDEADRSAAVRVFGE